MAAIRLLFAAVAGDDSAFGFALFGGVIGVGTFFLGKRLAAREDSESTDAKVGAEEAGVARLPPQSAGNSIELDEEPVWAQALTEFESDQRRSGLWAKSYAEASGSEALAKANYLKARVAEILQSAREASMQRERDARLAGLSEAERREAIIPRGSCPSCDAVIPLSSEECGRCRASFGRHSAWSVKPLRADAA